MTMSQATTSQTTTIDVAGDVETLQRDGIIGRQGAFSREWAEQMRQDMLTAFWDAIQRPGGAIPRGPRRWYVEVHPEAISGFTDLVTHPWVVAMSEAVLGPDYEIVEIGFDTPFEGARNQPWHRDFPSPVPSTTTADPGTMRCSRPRTSGLASPNAACASSLARATSRAARP
jgi:hypothetical protein